MLRIEIAKPCDQSWTAIKGDERVRHCLGCRKNVYNIGAMTEAEVGELIRRTEGHFCARVYRRTDGRVLTADCPRGVRAARRRKTLAVTAALTVVSALVYPLFAPATMGAVKTRHRKSASPLEPIGTTTGIVARPIYRDEEATTGKIAVPKPRE